MTSWRTIRGLTFSTIGRTVRASVHSSDGSENAVWFDPPGSWLVASVDGQPRRIENESHEYRFGDDGTAVHRKKLPNSFALVLGPDPTQLFRMYRWWPEPGSTASPRVSNPGEPVEVTVRGRPGWQVSFDDVHSEHPVTVVIDCELGVTLAWRQGGQWLEMSNPVLDEDFDPAMFTWNGPTVEVEDQAVSKEQIEYEQKMRDVGDMPPTRIGWLPTTIRVSPVGGDPLTGALDVTASAGAGQFAIRRWLTDVGEPDVSFGMEHYSAIRRTELGPWTVELRTYSLDVTDSDAQRVFDNLTLPDPPAAVDDVIAAAESRRSADEEQDVTEFLGTGHRLDDYLHADFWGAMVIRTDFTDDDRWREIALAAAAPVDSGSDDYPTFQANLFCIDNPENDGLTSDELLARIGDDPPTYAFLVDARTVSDPEMPILALDAGDPEYHEPGRTFRVIPSEMWGIENNLSIANMGFDDFANAADDDGVFRGYPPPPPHVGTLERDELIALSETNRSTPALAQFADELPEFTRPSAVIYEMARTGLHDSVAKLEPSPTEEVVGDADYLEATAREGLCHWGFVQITGGHWSLVIDPTTGTLEAVMLRRHRPQNQ